MILTIQSKDFGMCAKKSNDLRASPIRVAKRLPTPTWHDNLGYLPIGVAWLPTSCQKLATSSYSKITYISLKVNTFLLIFVFFILSLFMNGTILTIFKVANYWSRFLTKLPIVRWTREEIKY